MSLVNSAIKLIQDGRRVLAVDFDLEAPGLDTFDDLKPNKEIPGIIDFVAQYLQAGQAPDASDFISECTPIGELDGKLWIMPSGRNKTYAAKFNQIDWGDLYERRDGFLLFEDIKAQWKQILNPDYVLIDSRTGHTDTSGICTRQLPNAVVILFFPNEQNLRGLVDVVGDIRTESESPRKKHIELHFVMSNVPDLDDEDQILQGKIKAFQNQLGFRQEPMIVHRYDSLSLLNQVVFSKDRPKSRLAKEYNEIVREITIRNPDDRDGALEYIRRAERPWRWVNGGASMRERQDMLGRIQQAHPTDEEVLFRLSVLKESQGEPEAAFVLLSRAIDAGYNEADAYFNRSKFREQSGDKDGARKDAWHVLEFQQIPPATVKKAISRLMRLGPYELHKVVNSPAILSLGTDDKLWIAATLDSSLNDILLTISLLEPILNVSELSDSDRHHTKRYLGLSYMGLGRCSEAAGMFLDEGKNPNDLAIEDTFNYAMATWGATGTVRTDIFQRVVELGRSNSPDHADPDYLQCMAIAYWAAGDDKTALDYLRQAQGAIKDTRIRTEFSCWRYLQADKKSFAKDLDEIRALIEKPGSAVPEFIGTSKNAFPGIFRNGNEKYRFSVSFIFNHLRDRKWQHIPMLRGYL